MDNTTNSKVEKLIQNLIDSHVELVESLGKIYLAIIESNSVQQEMLKIIQKERY